MKSSPSNSSVQTLWHSVSIFVLAALLTASELATAQEVDSAQMLKRESQRRTERIARSIEALRSEVEVYGSWVSWERSLQEFRRRLKSLSEELSRQRLEFMQGEDTYLFHRIELKSFGHEREEDLAAIDEVASWSSPYRVVVDTASQLKKRGVDLIFIPIPSRVELYPEKIDSTLKLSAPISPIRKALILKLLEADVEAVDLLPLYRKHKQAHTEPWVEDLYHLDEFHYSAKAIKLTAKFIARRLKDYESIGKASDEMAITLSGEWLEETHGWAQEPELRDRYEWNYSQGTLNGKPLEMPPGDARILIIGDSFVALTALFVPSTQLPVHVWKELSIPLDWNFMFGGGGAVPTMLAKEGADFINSRRVIIWVTAAADFTNHWRGGWKPVKLP